MPYTQQFSPRQTPLRQLLPILRQYKGRRDALKTAIESAFFKAHKGAGKLAGNTLISLKAHGIVDGRAELTPFGASLINAPDETEAIRALARHILLDLDGVPIVETLREMKSAGERITLTTLPSELRRRGIQASDNSSDLSGILNWLEAAGAIRDYAVNDDAYSSLAGTAAGQIEDMKKLSSEQQCFLRALLALDADDFIDHSEVFDHAEGLYPGVVRFNRKAPEPTVLRPLEKLGYIELRRRDKSSPGARGGKATEARATTKLRTALADKILAALAKAAGYGTLREISSKSWADIVRDVREGKNKDSRSKALELLTVKICLTLDLQFMGWRETDEEITAGGEVDAMFHSDRLLYSRWQVQCKHSKTISYEALAKEIGVVQVTLANVILIASTGEATRSARSLRDRIVRSTPLNIIFIEGHHLQRLIEKPGHIVSILNEQAKEAMRIKAMPPEVMPAAQTPAEAGALAVGPGRNEAPRAATDPERKK